MNWGGAPRWPCQTASGGSSGACEDPAPQLITLRQVVTGLRRRTEVLRHRGDDVFCPVCGGEFDRFKDDWNRGNALCWRCGSHERHRVQWLLLDQRPRLLADAKRLLHFAPEWCLRRRLSRLRHLEYVTADLRQPGV